MSHTPVNAPPPFPPSSDVVALVVRGDKVVLRCLICEKDLPDDVSYLNQALVAWRDHQENPRQNPRRGGLR